MVVPTVCLWESELAKLLENTYRHVNIALMNEMAVFCHELGIDLWASIEAAGTKPFGFQAFYPGPGVGGHCIPIDPFYLTWKASEYNQSTSFIELAGEVNTAMPEHVINLTLDGLKKCKKSIKDSTVLILGISYKPDVKDIQLSPAKIIINKLMALGARIKIYDPYYKGSQMFGINVEQNIEDVLSKVDASIIITAHKEFQEINPKIFTKMKTPILIDSRGVVDTSSADDVGLVFRGLGRGI